VALDASRSRVGARGANVGAPSPDPGWSHVGIRGGATAVHLEGGWVLTANHIGPGNVWLGGVSYSWVPGSEVQLGHGDGSYADLVLFAVEPAPPLPPLEIAASTPAPGASLILIGHGHDRGAPISWGGYDGYDWAAAKTLRWGTNAVEFIAPTKVLGTWAFGSYFDEGGSAHEGQGANGDSGGAAFAWDGAAWRLAGLMYAVSPHAGQPSNVSLYGQLTYSADLSVYRDEILDVIALPEPRGAPWAGVALLAWLARRRQPFHQPRSRRRATPSCSVPWLPKG
jgi:hypothetical protein